MSIRKKNKKDDFSEDNSFVCSESDCVEEKTENYRSTSPEESCNHLKKENEICVQQIEEPVREIVERADISFSETKADCKSEVEQNNNDVDEDNLKTNENDSSSESGAACSCEPLPAEQHECSEKCALNVNTKEDAPDVEAECCEQKEFSIKLNTVIQDSIKLNHLGEELIESARNELRNIISADKKYHFDQQIRIKETKEEIASIRNDFGGAVDCIKQIYNRIQIVDSELCKASDALPQVSSFVEEKCVEINRELANIGKNIGGYERLHNFFYAYSELETMSAILSDTNKTKDYDTLAKEIGFRIATTKRLMESGFAVNGISLLCPEEKSKYDTLRYICDEPLDNIVNPIVKRTKHAGFKIEDDIIEKPVVEVEEEE